MLSHVLKSGHVGRAFYSSARATRHNHEPLRILFCGSDTFSIYSLNALNTFRNQQPDKIQSIDVLCRTDKRVGRGRRDTTEVPIKSIAQDLDLPLHQLDSFKQWTPPPSNLIVTASFGLLVPARILDGARYGGINVHPSLLPDLRGAAPIQHAILKRREVTGVSIQTMHPTKFDCGMVLAQQAVDVRPSSERNAQHRTNVGRSTQDMIDRLGPIAADLLVRTIDLSLFVKPEPITTAEQESKAPRITRKDREIDWQTWTADKIFVRDQALGQLWDAECYGRCSGNATKQTTSMSYDGPWTVIDESAVRVVGERGNVLLVVDRENDARRNRKVVFRTADGFLITPTSASIEFKAKNTGLEALQRYLESRARL